MRIGIISDTHDQIRRTARAVARLRAAGAEAIVHCGDLTRPDVVFEFEGIPTSFVFGNNDFDQAGLQRAMAAVNGVCLGRAGDLELGGKRIAVAHGDSTRDLRALAAKAPDYLLFGHSHLAADYREGPTRWINPGALHRAAEWTVGLLDLARDAYEVLIIDDVR